MNVGERPHNRGMSTRPRDLARVLDIADNYPIGRASDAA